MVREGTTWRAYDARTGTLTNMNITNVPTGTSVAGPSGEILRYSLTNLGTNANPNYCLTQWNSSKVFGAGQGLSPTGWYSGNIDANTPSAYDWNVSIPSLKTTGWNVGTAGQGAIPLVAVKDKLKRLKVNVDTLTLTATPIPRTLQFSLMGARDLSIIQTPPPNRYPIITEVHGFNEQLIREAILYEVARNGQVFFLHNRVQNIYELEAAIKRIVPGVTTAVAHGQMEGHKLEKVMLGFINGDYDVLVATTIIESGLDIPNANTIIIKHAENYGLSDLHQLRGRVGRSNKKAFSYLITPPPATLNQEARRRLHAIEEFSDLGSGFNIAMQDLDIRGAGNLLGAEQSGFIADIGYETYHKILNEAVKELKQE